jgi:outer membrane receptor for ferrienterochelin and colicins
MKNLNTRSTAGLALPLAALALLAAPAPRAHAQDAAAVVVRAEISGAPVEGARVTAGSVGTITDAAGEATLRLSAGEHVVRLRKLGLAAAELRLSLRPGADTTVVVEMKEEAIETEGIVVTSTRTERRIEDEPLRVEVVSREEVEEKLLMTPGDIAMLLNETAGLRVQPTAPSLGGASVRIQGLRGRYTQILSDGLPLYGGQAGALGPLQIPPMDLGQVEVIKGAASALYGSTALGGVVNLISRRPERERELLLNATTLGGSDAVLWLADELDARRGYTLLASVHRQGQADVDDDGWADLPGFQRATVRPRLFWNDGHGRSIFLTVGGMTEEREGGTLPGRTTPGGTAFPEELETRRLDAGLVGRALLGGSRLLSVRGSATAQRHRHLFGDVLERDLHETTFAEAALSGQDGRHAWVLGAAFQHERYEADDVPAFDFAYSVPALFAQDEYAPVEWLVLSASARLDQHSEYGTFLNPRLSALVRPGEWVIRASAGTGYFAPSPFTEETEAVGLARLEPYGEVRAERARSAMLDVGRELGPWELNATLFGSEIEDALWVRPAGGGKLALSNAPEPVRTRGTEVLARYHQGPIHLTATHVYIRSTELDPDGEGRREVPLTPRHTAGVVGAWEDEEWGRAGIEMYYTGAQALDENPYRAGSEPYLVLGFLVERRIGSVRAFLNAENLTDARQTAYDRLVLPARSPEGRWITDVWAPLEGRAFNAGVRLAF